jgi:NADH:quinone reductase (non-electrogenic)
MARILVLGAGFAGLWAAVGAARKLDEIGALADEVEIMVVDRNAYHNIRVRNYEVDLGDVAIPLGKVLDPIGVKHLIAQVETIDIAKQQVAVATPHGREILAYNRLVLALGSELARPDIPGLARNGFDVDSYSAALRLNAHISALGTSPASPGRATVVVVGAGFTGDRDADQARSRAAARRAPESSRRPQSGRWNHDRGSRAPCHLQGAFHARYRDTAGGQGHRHGCYGCRARLR